MEPLALLITAAAMEAPGERPVASAASDPATFELLMRQHERLVLATAFRLLGNMHDAQDVAQEAFFRLYRNLGRVRAAENVTGWLYRVTVNLCRDQQRRSRRITELEDMPAVSADPQQEFADAERRRALALSLRMLPEKERAALVLRDLEGLPTSQVAEILGSSEATIRSQISKARVKMKEFTERYFRRRV